jgi:hypothetical protein
MQKFRFLLPLLVLTLVLVAISLSIRSYNKPTENANREVVSNGEYEVPSSTESSAMENEEDQSLFSKILNLVKPKSTDTSVSVGTNPNASPSPQPLDTQFNTNQVEVGVDVEKEVAIVLPENTERPTGYTFNISYDPAVLSILKIEEGNTWDKTTVLRTTIDPNLGRASISAGQSLGSQNSSQGRTLVTLTVQAKSTTSVGSQIVILDSSEFAYVGLDYGIPLKSQSIQVVVQ